MITEDYVSFETAKLLKEKGFDEPCGLSEFDCDAYKKWVETAPRPITLDAESEKPFRYPVPSIYVAMKWLREKYNIHIEPRYFPTPNIYRYAIIHSPMTIENIDSHPQYFNTHEDACEAAIKYCLENLI